MAEGIKILDDAHSCHINHKNKLQKLFYDLLRDVFGIMTESDKYTWHFTQWTQDVN